MGRPYEGPKTRFDIQIPDHLARALKRDAKARNMKYTKWFVEAVTERLTRRTRRTRRVRPVPQGQQPMLL